MNQDVGELFGRIKLGDAKSVIGVVVLLLGLAAFALGLATWINANNQREDAAAQYEMTAASVAQVERLRDTTPDELRAELARLEGEMAALLADFPSGEQTRLLVSSYYAAAMQVNTQLTRLESVLPPTPQGSGLPYLVERYAIEAQGEFANLLRFLANITQSAYKTYSFDNLALTRGAPTTANLNLTIFSAQQPQTLRAPALGLYPAQGAPAPNAANAAEADRLQAILQGAVAAGDWPVAIAYGERVLALDPTRQEATDLLVRAHLWYARQLAASGQREQGRQQLTAALSLRPGDPELLAELGKLGGR